MIPSLLLGILITCADAILRGSEQVTTPATAPRTRKGAYPSSELEEHSAAAAGSTTTSTATFDMTALTALHNAPQPWTATTEAEANTVALSLQQYQQSKHLDVRAERTKLARNLIDSIQSQGSEFVSKKMKIIGEAESLKGEIQNLLNKLGTSVGRYNSSMDSLALQVNQFKTNEQEAVETERAKIDTQFKSVGDQVQQRVDEVIAGKDNGIGTLIDEQKMMASGKIEKMQTEVSKVESDAEQSEQEVLGSVEADMNKITGKIEEFEALVGGSEEDLNKLKDSIDGNTGVTMELEELLKDETRNRQDEFGEMLTTAASQDAQMKTDLTENDIAPAKAQFQQHATNAMAKEVAMTHAIETAKQLLETTNDNAINDMTKTVGGYVDGLSTKLDDVNTQLQSLTGAVVAETDRQKEFPRYAEKKLARLELEAANGFNDVRAKGQEFVKSLTDQYLEKAKLLSTTADEEIADKEAQFVNADKNSVADIMQKAAAAKTSALDDLITKKTKIEQSQEEIAGLNEQAATIVAAVNHLEGQAKKTEEAIAKKFDLSKKTVENNARAVVQAAESQLKTNKKAVLKAFSRAKKRLEKTQDKEGKALKKARDGAVKQLDAQVRFVKKQQAHINTTGERSEKKMDQAKKVINDTLARVRSSVIQAKQDVDTFKMEAMNGVSTANTTAVAALSDAGNVVNTYLDTLTESIRNANNSIRDAITPKLAKLKQSFESSKDTFESKLAGIRRKTQVTKEQAANRLFSATEITNENLQQIKQMDSAGQQQFTKAKMQIQEDEAKLQQSISGQNQKLTDTEQELSTFVSKMATDISGKAQAGMDETGRRLTQMIQRTSQKVDDQVAKLSDVETSAKTLESKAEKLTSHAGQLRTMLAAARQAKEELATTAGSQVADLENHLDGYAAAQRQASADLKNRLEGKEREALKDVEAGVAQSEADFKGAMTAAGTAMAQQTDSAGAKVNQQNAKIDQEITDVEGRAGQELSSAQTGVQQVNDEVSTEEERMKLADEKIAAETAKIRVAQEQQSVAFKEEMKSFGERLGSELGIGAEDIAQIQERAAEIAETTSANLTAMGAADDRRLSSLVASARGKLEGVQQRVGAIQAKADGFAAKIASVSTAADKAGVEAKRLQGTFDNDIAEAKRNGLDSLYKEKMKREEKMTKSTTEMKADLGQFSDTLNQMNLLAHDVVGGGLAKKIGELNLKENKMNRDLKNALELEKYQDTSKLLEIEKKLQEGVAKEQDITSWREETEDKAKKFQAAVIGEFQKLGVVVDMSELDMARAKAEEKFAVQEQMRQMKSRLGSEMGKISAVAEARLAALATANGKEIAELMKDEKLTAQERAARLEEIRQRARKRASEIMESDARMALDQRTVGRRIELAQGDVEQFMGRVASLEGPAPTAGELSSTIGRIRDLITEANKETEVNAPPASLTEVQEKQAEQKAGERFLRTETPTAMLEVATKDSERMQAEDDKWKHELEEMNAALDKQELPPKAVRGMRAQS